MAEDGEVVNDDPEVAEDGNIMKELFGFDPLEEGKEEEDGELKAPANRYEAWKDLKEAYGREPTTIEINDWLRDMNEPFSNDPF